MKDTVLAALAITTIFITVAYSDSRTATEGAAAAPPPCADYVVNDLVDIQDVISFLAPVRHFDTSPGDINFDERWDRLPGPGPIFPNWINIQDLIDAVFQFGWCDTEVRFLSKLTDLDDQWRANKTATAAMMNTNYEAIQTFDCGICREFGNAFNGTTFVYQDPTKICGPSDAYCSPECEGEQPGTDCSDILLTTTGQRCWQRFFVGARYIADITQEDVRNEIVAKAIALEAEPAFDGIYIDVAEAYLPNAADCPGQPARSVGEWLSGWALLAESLASANGPLILNFQYVNWNNLVATNAIDADRFWRAPDVIEYEFGWVQGRHGEGTVSGAADKLAYIDRLHSLGTAVYDFERRADDSSNDYTPAQESFGLAMYLIGREAGDYYGTFSHDGHGSAFGWTQDYGEPLGPRRVISPGFYARDYQAGTVTANVTTKTGVLP